MIETRNAAAGGRPLAVVTGASTGIGLELAKICARNGFDLVVAADEPAIRTAAEVDALVREGSATGMQRLRNRVRRSHATRPGSTPPRDH